MGTDSKKVPAPEHVKLLTPASVCQHGVETREKQHEACQVSCGASHSVAVSTDGNVWVWGSGVQLGLGETRNALKPVMLETFKDKTVIKAHCGDYHSVVVVEHKDGDKERGKSRDRPATTSESSALAVKEVKSAKESTTESLCAECNRLVGHDRDDVDSAIELQDHVFQPGSDNAGSGNETVDTRRDPVTVIENHFGDKTLDKSVRDNTTLKSTRDPSDTQTAAKTVEISESARADALVSETEVKMIENVDQDETTAKITDTTPDEIVDETNIKTIDVINDKATLEASAGIETASSEPTSLEAANLDPSSLEGDIGDPLGVSDGENKSSAEGNMVSEVESKDSATFDVVSLSEVQIRSKQPVELGEDPLTQSLKSTISVSSSASSRSRSKTFLNEAETREFLAKQFEDDDGSSYVKGSSQEPVTTSTPKKETKGLVDEGVKQDLGALTSYMTTSISSFTSKAFGNITSVFSMSDDPQAAANSKTRGSETEPLKDNGETLKENDKDRKSCRESDISVASDRSDSPGLDESAQEMYTLGDITTNVSLMSLPDAETSLQTEVVAEASPRKKREGADRETVVKKPVQGSPVAVSKQSQSIRTIEAKQEQLRKRSSNLPQAGKQIVIVKILSLWTP